MNNFIKQKYKKIIKMSLIFRKTEKVQKKRFIKRLV